jgi:hypothetical protein
MIRGTPRHRRSDPDGGQPGDVSAFRANLSPDTDTHADGELVQILELKRDAGDDP